ncbi:hypothetical protein [Actinomadura sp. 9N215]|uniref:hypothetical protein n=1 Tax=Actinomadura sp. 9N215 TaxID=3375150 RepID=UPI0037982AE1
MDPLLDRIAERRALLAEQAQRLAKELAEVEAELERIATAEQVVAQLLVEADDGPDGADEHHQSRRSPALVVAHRDEAGGVTDLPAEYQRLMQIVTEEGPAGQGVVCKRVTVKLGLTAEPRHTEGVRVKLKRLVARGWLTESAPDRFTVRP